MTTHQDPAQQPAGEPGAPQVLEEPYKTQLPAVDDVVDVHVVETGSSGLETCRGVINNEGSSLLGGSSSAAPSPLVVDEVTKEAVKAEGLSGEDNARERLKKHRIEMAGTRVWIPDIWGQEELLKDWIDCSAFEAALVPSRIMSARAALVEEGRRANSGGFRIENRC